MHTYRNAAAKQSLNVPGQSGEARPESCCDLHRRRPRGGCADHAIRGEGFTTEPSPRHPRHYSEAIVHHQKALAVAHELAEPYQEARSLCSIGDLHLHSQRYDLALDDYRAALELSRRMGDPYQEGLALSGMARAQYHLPDKGPAFDRWREALALFEKIGVPEADEVRRRLLAAGLRRPQA